MAEVEGVLSCQPLLLVVVVVVVVAADTVAELVSALGSAVEVLDVEVVLVHVAAAVLVG